MTTVRDLNADVDPDRVASFGRIRRMAISFTANVLWQLAGFRLPAGDQETLNAEPFTGIGIFGRPPNGSKPEAIVVNVGGANATAIVAVRDEQTRAAMAGQLVEDETMLYNSQACVHAKADGTIEVRSKAGVAIALSTKADLDALANWIHTTMTVTTPGAGAGASTPGTTNAPPAAAGTTVLKGE